MSKLPLVAIIDDDESVRATTDSLVRSLGHVVHTFASAEEFLASDDFERFTCAITDIHMPGMNGFELQERLQKRKCSLPVIMITARTEPDLEKKALSGGAIGFLRKPLDVEILVGFIEKALRG